MSPRTFYYAQPFRTAGRMLSPGQAHQCVSAQEAINTAARLAGSGAGAIACRIDGDPRADVWSDPVTLASYGRVPG